MIDSNTGVAERQVDDLDLVGRVILADPFERIDHVARLTRAIISEDAQCDDVHLRRDARVVTERQLAVTRDDAGDVRAVTATINRRAAAADEILELANAAEQVGVRVNSGIDDRDRRAAQKRGNLAAGGNRTHAPRASGQPGRGRGNNRVNRRRGSGGELRCECGSTTEDHESRAGFGLGRTNCCAAIEQPIEGSVARRICRELHDDASRRAGVDSRLHCCVGGLRSG